MGAQEGGPELWPSTPLGPRNGLSSRTESGQPAIRLRRLGMDPVKQLQNLAGPAGRLRPGLEPFAVYAQQDVALVVVRDPRRVPDGCLAEPEV